VREENKSKGKRAALYFSFIKISNWKTIFRFPFLPPVATVWDLPFAF
jgi:hypothetical protein